MKESFVLYRSVYEAVKDLPDEMFREWVLAVMEYGLNQKEPETPIGKAAVGSVRKWMDEDNARYTRVCERNRQNGKKGGRPKTQENPVGFSGNPNKPNGAVWGLDTDTDTDTDNKKEKEHKKEKEIVDYLNQKTGKAFRASSEKTRTLIRARIREGYSEADFKKVIDNKCNDWLSDPERAQYLRPETLFGTKFESYLNQKPVIRTGGFRNFTERTDDLDADMIERMKEQHKAYREREQA